MIILGLILLIVGWIIGFHLLVTLGVILVIVGVVFVMLSAAGHAVGGRNWY